jgi:hypothetical protein
MQEGFRMINPNAQYHQFLKAYQERQRDTYKELKGFILVSSLTLKDTDKGKHFITSEGLEAYKINPIDILRGLK